MLFQLNTHVTFSWTAKTVNLFILFFFPHFCARNNIVLVGGMGWIFNCVGGGGVVFGLWFKTRLWITLSICFREKRLQRDKKSIHNEAKRGTNDMVHKKAFGWLFKDRMTECHLKLYALLGRSHQIWVACVCLMIVISLCLVVLMHQRSPIKKVGKSLQGVPMLRPRVVQEEATIIAEADQPVVIDDDDARRIGTTTSSLATTTTHAGHIADQKWALCWRRLQSPSQRSFSRDLRSQWQKFHFLWKSMLFRKKPSGVSFQHFGVPNGCCQSWRHHYQPKSRCKIEVDAITPGYWREASKEVQAAAAAAAAASTTDMLSVIFKSVFEDTVPDSAVGDFILREKRTAWDALSPRVIDF